MLWEIAAGASTALALAGAADDEQQPSIVITGERLNDAAEEVASRPGGADLVPAEEYENKVAVSLRDALAFSPGVYAQPRFGQEVRLSIRGSGISRGFHMRGLTLLQDGIPINLADDNGDFHELDPTILREIQVLRGANALRFGGSTLGGAVNGITPTGSTASGVNLRLDGGSFATLRGLASFGTEADWGDAWVALNGDRSDGARQHDRRRALRFNGNIGLNAGGVQTRFYANVQTIDQQLPGALTFGDAIMRPRKGSFAGDQQRDIDSVRLQNRTAFAFGQASAEVGAFVNIKSLFHPIFQVVDQESADYGAFGRVHWGTGRLDLTGGITARFGTMDSARFVNVNGRRGAMTFKADLSARTIDAYGELRYRLGGFSLIAGGIYTHGVREQDRFVPAIARARASYDQFSPKFGLLYEPGSQLTFYANLSRSHELPGFIELAQIASFVPLAAQRAWTAETGVRGQAGIARFDLSIYRARVKGELLQFSVGPDIPAPTFNADRTLHQGIEAGLDLDLARWARLRQVYQFNDFRFRGDAQFGDNRLPVIPRHLYRAELRLGTEDLRLSPSLEWVPRGAWADYTNSFKVAGYVSLSFTAEAKAGSSISLFVDARNLTGKRAIGDISAVVQYQGQAIFYPVERRSIFGGVRARF